MTDTTLDLCQKPRKSSGANLPVVADAQKAFPPFGSPVVMAGGLERVPTIGAFCFLMAVGLERVPTIGAFCYPPARRQNRIPE